MTSTFALNFVVIRSQFETNYFAWENLGEIYSQFFELLILKSTSRPLERFDMTSQRLALSNGGHFGEFCQGHPMTVFSQMLLYAVLGYL